MTAKEAKRVATYNRAGLTSGYMERIAEVVLVAAKDGRYETDIPLKRITSFGGLPDPDDGDWSRLITALEADGYTVIQNPDGLVLRWSR